MLVINSQEDAWLLKDLVTHPAWSIIDKILEAEIARLEREIFSITPKSVAFTSDDVNKRVRKVLLNIREDPIKALTEYKNTLRRKALTD